MNDFQDKVAIVTGAGSGIGAAIARELAERGAVVIAADIDLAAAQDVASEIRGDGGRADAIEVDVADPEAAERLVKFAVETGGGLHLAVNNAGIGGPNEATADYPLDDWKRVIDINLNGVFYGMKYQIAAMLESGGGAIVNLSSILGSVGWAGSSAYVTAKHGLIGLTRTAAIEYAGGPARHLGGGVGADLLPAFRQGKLHHRQLPSGRWRLYRPIGRPAARPERKRPARSRPFPIHCDRIRTCS
jgi:NAD(P)-dependent dehydrogenase (short-subunit alcohol dehydrogenase family)